jgi:hypothetical protein
MRQRALPMEEGAILHAIRLASFNSDWGQGVEGGDGTKRTFSVQALLHPANNFWQRPLLFVRNVACLSRKIKNIPNSTPSW